MSIAEQITRIKTNISNAYDKCEAKGATIPTDKNSANLATTIDSITGGSAPSIAIKSPYADDNGKFVKPAEWDDIESIPIAEGEQVVYYLFDNTLDFSWCSIQVNTNSGNSLCEYGRVVNGQFQSLGVSTSVASGQHHRKILSEEFPNENYIVLKITPATAGRNLTICNTSNYSYNSRNLTSATEPILMRYGNMPYANNITTNGNQSIVSDNVMNCGALTTLANYYSNSCNLVRHRHTGWNTANVTTSASMFQNCRVLSDIDEDFSGWFSGGKLTNIGGMFNGCRNITKLYVSGWVTDNITSLAQVFNGCYNLEKIEGIEGWYLPKATHNTTPTETFFTNCYKLKQNDGVLDLSNWHLAENSTANTTMQYFFSSCFNLKEINLSGWNFANITTLNQTFGNAYNLKKVIFPEGTGSNNKLTNINSTFNFCFNLDNVDFRKIDIQSATNVSSFLGSCTNLRDFTTGTIVKALDISGANNLSHESLIGILNNLATVSSATTLTLGAVNLSKLTADEIAIATNKGWSLA